MSLGGLVSGEMSDGDELRESSSGSGNAEARRMKFASVDALSELVWSPRNGLTLRCADFTFTGKPPNFFDIGQSSMALLSNSTTAEQATRMDNEVNQACNEMNTPISGIGGSNTKPEREEMARDKVVTSDDIEKSVGSSKRLLDSPRAIEGKSGDLLAKETAGSQEEQQVLVRLESTDENDVANLAVVASKAVVDCESKGECTPEDEKAGPSGSYRHSAKAKGKDKALPDGNFEGDDESFGSVESCNSAGLLSRGKKRLGFEQQLILGSKRLKTLGEECLGSTSKLKQDSSFMNWISNMTKGIWKDNEEEDNSPFVALTTTSVAKAHVTTVADHQQPSPCSLKETSGCRGAGFQSFFQSIYCPRKRSLDVTDMDLRNDAIPAPLRELPWIPEQGPITKEDHLSSSGNKLSPVAEPNISSAKVGFIQTSQTFSSENKHEDKETNISLLSFGKSKPKEEQKPCGEADGKVTQCLTNRNSGVESLWISRFSSRSSFPQKKDFYEAAKEVIASTSEAAKTCDSHKISTYNNVAVPAEMLSNPNTTLHIVSSLRIESLEAISCMFSRRLEALKHIMPSSSLAENSEEGDTDVTCFYCGKKGHWLRDCMEVSDTELIDLVQNISARDGREDESSLCIRCLQLSHWAVTCPNAPPYNSGAEDRVTKHALASTSGTKLPLKDFTSKQVTDVPKAVFNAVQLLRLTRTDVLKWMNTKMSVSGLEGFFLRIRLGKWEEGIGGTGYHVARIDGAKESSKRHSEKSSISVKVGGLTCFVESQFISNQNFLEEELKAWWRSAGKLTERSGSHSNGIPTEEELSRKIQQRKMLGF